MQTRSTIEKSANNSRQIFQKNHEASDKVYLENHRI